MKRGITVSIKELIQRQNEFLNELHLQMCEDLKTIVSLAENMTECATNIKGQGYQSFIKSREEFIGSVNSFERDYRMLLCSKLNDDVENLSNRSANYAAPFSVGIQIPIESNQPRY